jgi:hypothetical protein
MPPPQILVEPALLAPPFAAVTLVALEPQA